MRLRDFLESYGGGPTAFAAAIGVSAQAVYRYASGQRVPRRAVMARIAAVTQGAVSSVDFYEHGVSTADAVDAANDRARRAGNAATLAPVRHEKLPEAA